MNQILSISWIDKEFNESVYKFVGRKQDNIENLVEKSIALVPWLLFKTYSELEFKNNLDKFCICINYASRLFPNKRFHIHTNQGEVKTFCWKSNGQSDFSFDDISSNYNMESPFVGLLDIFYRINQIKSEGKDNFSMNKYLETRNGPDQQDIVCLDESEYNSKDVLSYLKEKYNVANVNYNRYAAYLWIATGDIQGNPLLQKKSTADTDQLLLEVLELMASNKDVFPKWADFKKDNKYYQYNIPIFGFDKDKVKVICNIIIPSLVEFSEEIQNAIRLLTNLWINRIWDYENNAWAEANAVRASIAQVMARNMSHNFGSHVLSNLIGDGVYDKVKDEAVEKDLKRFISTDEWNKEVFKNDGKNRQLPFFFQYLKSRMDYLSEVTFGVSNLLTTKMMYNDVMKELDQVRILLNYISGVSNFQYRFKLKYIGVDGEVDLEKEKQKDIGVAFPSDVLGCQAFYNIIENIIRNTAKHAKNKNGETVTFTITIKDDFAKEAGCEDIEGVNELYCVEIDNGVAEEDIDTIVNGKTKTDDKGTPIKIKGQNDRLNDSVLDTSNNLRSHSLGLLEMEASAAFLRQIDLPEIESDDYTVDLDDKFYHVDSKGKKRLNVLKAFAIDVKEETRTNDEGETIKVKTGKLGYRFFLQKPKEFLLVGEWGVTDEKKKQLLNCGIQFIKKKDFCLAMEAEKAFAHQFLIYQEGISEDIEQYWNNDCKTLLPLRRLSISNEEWETISKEWPQLAQQDDMQNKSGDQDKKLNGKDILLQLKKWAWEKYVGNANDIIICGEAFEDSTGLKQIVFLDHGERFEDVLKTREGNMKNGGVVWIENLSSRTSGKLPRFVDLSTGSRKTQLKNYINNIEDIAEIKAEIFEAYHYRVIVLDERIQKFSNENTEGSSKNTTIKIPCSQLFETTDVLIPDTPLDPNSFSKESVEELERFVATNITTDAFVLVHYGVLERMYGEIKSIDDKLTEWATKARRVVVTSGRGAHSLKLPKKVCFVNLSSALYAFCENRNKYIINNLLNQSRRKRNE